MEQSRLSTMLEYAAGGSSEVDAALLLQALGMTLGRTLDSIDPALLATLRGGVERLVAEAPSKDVKTITTTLFSSSDAHGDIHAVIKTILESSSSSSSSSKRSIEEDDDDDEGNAKKKKKAKIGLATLLSDKIVSDDDDDDEESSDDSDDSSDSDEEDEEEDSEDDDDDDDQAAADRAKARKERKRQKREERKRAAAEPITCLLRGLLKYDQEKKVVVWFGSWAMSKEAFEAGDKAKFRYEWVGGTPEDASKCESKEGVIVTPPGGKYDGMFLIKSSDTEGDFMKIEERGVVLQFEPGSTEGTWKFSGRGENVNGSFTLQGELDGKSHKMACIKTYDPRSADDVDDDDDDDDIDVDEDEIDPTELEDLKRDAALPLGVR